jgi:hypothetical protein
MNKLSQAAISQRLDDAGIRAKLLAMISDDSMNTNASYSANSTLYPDNEIPFVDKHMAYLMSHPKVNYDHYLGNLRLMLKKRG